MLDRALALALGAMAADAHANEGAGGAMPFARFGAGARALGMGGAYAAQAADPSAPLWNPAGLARLNGLQVSSQYSWLSLGRAFHFVSAAYGLAGTGGAAFTYVYFTAGDVDVRSGNTLEAEGTMRDRESLMLVSFAMPVNERLHAGGALKVFSHKLAGGGVDAAGGGVGVDLGITYEHRPGWRSAVVLLDPYTRINWKDGWGDTIPFAIRAGTAIEAWKIERHSVVAEADLEQNVRLQNPRWRLGAEYAWRNAVFARAGLRYLTPTLGLGFRQSFSFFTGRLDLAFEPDRLDEFAFRLSASAEF